MRILKALLLSIPLSVMALTQAHDASACGGCLVSQTEPGTQVTGHKMVLSVSNVQTTLWDQITYSGKPSSFAWVLPIKGVVEVGLSSDALFQNLDQFTQTTVNSPVIQCTPPPDCGGQNGGFGAGASSGTGGTGGDAGGPPVTVLAQDVVGPYEMVQLQSSVPGALETWLNDHKYAIPADISPVIDAYVLEGFNFLALKLVPLADVASMRPVRVTTPGASPVLPLRMVAAGTGPVTPITLWVFGEGRYETANLPTTTLDPTKLVWNWDTQKSNYSALRKAIFDDSKGKAWLAEAAEPMSKYQLTDTLTYLAQSDPKGSGYADDMGQGAEAAVTDDLNHLFGNIDETSLWITRLHGELSRAALADDLELGASADQSYINRYLQADKAIGTPPPCPTFPPCLNPDGPGKDGGWDFWGNFDGAPKASSGTSCAMTEGGGAPALMSAWVLVAALAVSRARRRRA